MSFTDNTTGCTVWETPPAFFAALDEEFHFTLDVCATAANAKCVRFYTEAEDGLAQEWEGICWMNPPYGRGVIEPWVKKAANSKATVVCLLPSRTDNSWWHRYVMMADEIRFVRGRLRFVGAPAGAKFPSAVVVFRGTNDSR